MGMAVFAIAILCVSAQRESAESSATPKSAVDEIDEYDGHFDALTLAAMREGELELEGQRLEAEAARPLELDGEGGDFVDEEGTLHEATLTERQREDGMGYDDVDEETIRSALGDENAYDVSSLVWNAESAGLRSNDPGEAPSQSPQYVFVSKELYEKLEGFTSYAFLREKRLAEQKVLKALDDIPESAVGKTFVVFDVSQKPFFQNNVPHPRKDWFVARSNEFNAKTVREFHEEQETAELAAEVPTEVPAEQPTEQPSDEPSADMEQ